jgi:hypothetical protein
VLLDVDWDRGVMRFHAFDSHGPDAFRERLERFYAERQRPVVP